MPTHEILRERPAVSVNVPSKEFLVTMPDLPDFPADAPPRTSWRRRWGRVVVVGGRGGWMVMAGGQDSGEEGTEEDEEETGTRWGGNGQGERLG